MTVNHDVTGSSPVWGAIFFAYFYHGGIPERPKGTDCKSVGTAFEGSNPSPSILYIRQSVDNLQAGFLLYINISMRKTHNFKNYVPNNI